MSQAFGGITASPSDPTEVALASREVLKDSTEGRKKSDLLTTAELAALRVPARKTIDQLIAGGVFYVAHSAAGNFEGPMYTDGGYQLGQIWGHSARIIPDGMNFIGTTEANGIPLLADLHDTNGAGLLNGVAWSDSVNPNLASLSLNTLRTTVTMKASAYMPFGGKDQFIRGFDDLVSLWGGPWPHSPELKNAAAVGACIRQYTEKGWQPFSLVHFGAGAGAFATVGPRLRGAGFDHIGWVLTSGVGHSGFTTATAQSLLAAGVNWVIVDRTQASAPTVAQIAKAAGMYVMVWNVWRFEHMTQFVAVKVDCWSVETPRYLAKMPGEVGRRRTSFESGNPGCGWIPSSDVLTAQTVGFPTPVAIADDFDRWHWQPIANTGSRGDLVGCMVPAAGEKLPDRYTLTVPFKVLSRGAVDARYGLFIAVGKTDAPCDIENSGQTFPGWGVRVRHSADAAGNGNGQLQFRYCAGVVAPVQDHKDIAFNIANNTTWTWTLVVDNIAGTVTATLAGGAGTSTVVATVPPQYLGGDYLGIGYSGGIGAAEFGNGEVTLTPNL